MYYIYILQNTVTKRYYIGSTEDLEARLARHNNGYVKSTKYGVPNWKRVYSESFQSRAEAVQRENQIKKKKSRKYIEWLISQKEDSSTD